MTVGLVATEERRDDFFEDFGVGDRRDLGLGETSRRLEYVKIMIISSIPVFALHGGDPISQ